MDVKKQIALSFVILLGLFGVYHFALPFFTRDVYQIADTAKSTDISTSSASWQEPEVPKITHLSTPKPLRAIYMTACVAGIPSLRNNLVKIADDTEINAIVIDIKDYTGTISFEPENPALKDFVTKNCIVRDMKDFIQTLHEKDMYVIGRITTFQDPFFAKREPEVAVKRESDGGIWADRKGINYLDPGAKKVWDHVVSIANESYAIGFDEINFDYIRFPSDGNMKDISFPVSGTERKSEVIESFFSYLHDKLKPTGLVISADLFGMTTTNYDDLGIGQVLEKTLPYFDYVSPMVYPSHYPPTFNGWADPNKHAAELIYYVMGKAIERTVASTTRIRTNGSEMIASTSPELYTKPEWDKDKLRPWLQDFQYGGHYGIPEVRGQIQSAYDVGLDSWMLWSPSNHYTLGALLPYYGATTSTSTIIGI
jgi:hypothetical protein